MVRKVRKVPILLVAASKYGGIEQSGDNIVKGVTAGGNPKSPYSE